MSSSPRRSGSNKKSSSSASPLLNSLLRTAVSALSSDSKSSDRHSSSSHRSQHPEPGHLPRSHTQPEFRRQGDYDPSAGIPSHTTPSSSKDHTFDLLKTAAYELGKLVHDVEGKIRPSDKDKYRPEGIRSDADRFEEIADDSESTRHRSSRRRGRSADSGRHRERHRGGHADEYYGNSAPLPPQQQAGGQFGYGDYTQQFNPAAQTHSYPYPPPGPQQQQHHLNHHDNNNYTHPMPSPQPMYSDSERPKLKRSKTSASKFAGDMGGELMRNLPALLDKAAWLLGLLEKKNATTRGGSGSSAGHSALLMALSLVMELYRNLGGADKIRSYNEKRALKKERGMRAEERYERY